MHGPIVLVLNRWHAKVRSINKAGTTPLQSPWQPPFPEPALLGRDTNRILPFDQNKAGRAFFTHYARAFLFKIYNIGFILLR